MLWSCPSRAHLPIVPAVNFTLDEASNSAASEREIQSDGGLGIGQSGSFAGEAASEDTADSPEVDGDFSAELEPGSSDATRFALLVPDRSLRAQPLPLK